MSGWLDGCPERLLLAVLAARRLPIKLRFECFDPWTLSASAAVTPLRPVPEGLCESFAAAGTSSRGCLPSAAAEVLWGTIVCEPGVNVSGVPRGLACCHGAAACIHQGGVIPSLLGWAAPRPAPDDAPAAVEVGSELIAIAGQRKPLQAMRGQLLGEGGGAGEGRRRRRRRWAWLRGTVTLDLVGVAVGGS